MKKPKADKITFAYSISEDYIKRKPDDYTESDNYTQINIFENEYLKYYFS